MKQSPNRLRNQRGQAIIEYILLLIVILLLILGAAYQFNSAFRVFVTNYFSNYTACLLETGELPALGGAGGGNICGEEFQRFNPDNGTPLVQDTGRTPGGTGGTGATTSPPPAPPGSAGTDGRGGAPSARSDGGGGSSGGGGSGGIKSASSLFNSRGRPQRMTLGNASGNEANYTGSTEGLKTQKVIGQLDSSRDGKNDRMTLDRRYFASDDDDDKKGEQKLDAPIAGAEGERLRPKKLRIESRGPSSAKIDENGPGFSFGALLRWLLIAAIVIALVLLLGGQALQISKSWEK